MPCEDVSRTCRDEVCWSRRASSIINQAAGAVDCEGLPSHLGTLVAAFWPILVPDVEPFPLYTVRLRERRSSAILRATTVAQATISSSLLGRGPLT